MMGRLSERIQHTSAPVDSLLREEAQRRNEGVCGLHCFLTDDEPATRERWICSIEKNGMEKGLTADDRILLTTFARELGKSDLEGERKFCDDYRELLRSHIEQAKQELKSRGNAYFSLGVCGGVAVAVLLW